MLRKKWLVIVCVKLVNMCVQAFVCVCVCVCYGDTGFALALSTSFPLAPGGSGRFLLDDLECSGMEGNLFQCVSGGLGVSDCDMWENAGVTCTCM